MSILFDEAVEALIDVRELQPEESQKVMKAFENSFSFQTSGNGKIDWEFVKNQLVLEHIDDLRKQNIFNVNDICFVIWNDETYPIIETNVENVLNAFDDVTAVSFDTWIFIPNKQSVIENIFGSLKVAFNQ